MKSLSFIMFFCLLIVLPCNAQWHEKELLYQKDNYYSKRMVKAFVAAKEHKLEKVENYWQDMIDKYAKDKINNNGTELNIQMSPVWQLSECMVMGSNLGREKGKVKMAYNPWNAYLLLKSVTSLNWKKQNADAFLSHKDIGLSVDAIKSLVEKELVGIAVAKGTEEVYDSLINILYNYADIDKIKQNREKIAFSTVIQTTEVRECLRYLKKYDGMNAVHLDSVCCLRDSLAFIALDTTANACHEYLTAYPKSRFIEDVTLLLHKYAFNEMSHTEEACKQYIANYPTSEYVERVKTLMLEYAFEDAKKNGHFTAYRDYLQKYEDTPYKEEALKLMESALLTRYFNSHVALDDLYKYFSTQNAHSQVDDSKIRKLYYNLLAIPTSALMKDCDGLVGQVKNSTSVNGTENEEVFQFTQQGLLKSYSNSKSGLRIIYQYAFDETYGFKLDSKTDNKGNTVNYTTKYDAQGNLSEISGSDGMRVVYSFVNDKYLEKMVYYHGKSIVKTDYYDTLFRLEKSVRNGVTIIYKYNNEGDVVSMFKQKGGITLDSTTYEHEYESENSDVLWTQMSQYNNDNYLLTKYRYFNQVVNRVQSSYHHVYHVTE